jgi:hypothetical protein
MRRLFSFPLWTALVLVGVVSFAVTVALQARAQLVEHPPIAVDRTLKSDRLPIAGRIATESPGVSIERMRPQAQPSRDTPVGCDPLFSPISAPGLAHLYRRCLT